MTDKVINHEIIKRRQEKLAKKEQESTVIEMPLIDDMLENKEEPDVLSRKELLLLISDEIGYEYHECNGILQGVVNAIHKALLHGKKVLIKNLGTFEVKISKRPNAHDPRNLQKMPSIREKKRMKFKAGISLLRKLNVEEGTGDLIVKKRPVGRPRKQVPPAVEEKPVSSEVIVGKRKRGRPRKNPL